MVGERRLAENTEWLLLEDAIRIYGDPRLWAAYQEALLREKSVPPRPSWFGSEARKWRDWQATYQGRMGSIRDAISAAERLFYKDFKDRLRAGTLVALGIKVPIIREAGPEPIAASLWDVLQLDVPSNRVHTKGLVYAGVRICRAEEGRHLIVEPPPATVVASRQAGRPSISSVLRAELKRRADSGEMLDQWRPEARVLAAWVQGEYPKRAPRFESIERRLRDEYKQLKADKNPG
jgi:hypothetical protein